MSEQAIEPQLRNEIIDVYTAYAEGIDSKNWPLVRSCFDEQVYLDYGELSAGQGSPDQPQPIESWMAHLQSAINGFDCTQHILSNYRFHREDELVVCRAYLSADHIIFPDVQGGYIGADDVVTVVGEYSNAYQASEQGWKILKSRLQVFWLSGNPELFARAQQRLDK